MKLVDNDCVKITTEIVQRVMNKFRTVLTSTPPVR